MVINDILRRDRLGVVMSLKPRANDSFISFLAWSAPCTGKSLTQSRPIPFSSLPTKDERGSIVPMMT